MKIKLKHNELYFPGIKHFIVAQLPNGKFRFFKSTSILSVSTTNRIIKKMLSEAVQQEPTVLKSNNPRVETGASDLLHSILAEKSQLEDHINHGELKEYGPNNAADLLNLFNRLIREIGKGAEQDAA